jgi:hypothetical protein
MERRINNIKELKLEILRQKTLVKHREEFIKTEAKSLFKDVSSLSSAGKFAFSSLKNGFSIKRGLFNFLSSNFHKIKHIKDIPGIGGFIEALSDYLAQKRKQEDSESKIKSVFKGIFNFFKRK